MFFYVTMSINTKTHLTELHIMKKKKMALSLIACCLLLALPSVSALEFTPEQQQFIAESPIINIIFIEGTAPISYLDKGEPKGIAVEFYEEVARRTGLQFHYQFTDNVMDPIKQIEQYDIDIMGAIAPQYIMPEFENNPISNPYLKCKTVLYVNADNTSDSLDGKIFAAIKGGTLPSDVNPDHARYYETRELSMQAVNKGIADYGYGNEFSVAFYTIQYGLDNITIIPTEQETREYYAVFCNTNEQLVSVVNQAIDSIDKDTMQSIVLRGTACVQRNVTVTQVFHTFGGPILTFLIVALVALSALVVLLIFLNKKTKEQYQHITLLSEISEDYIYSYEVHTNIFDAPPKTRALLSNFKCLEGCNIENGYISSKENNGLYTFMQHIITIPAKNNEIACELVDGTTQTFRVINATIHEKNQYTRTEPQCIVGKFVDISRETQEKQELLQQAQMDAMTGVLNKTSFQQQVTQIIADRKPNQTCVLIIFDIDDFKQINDTYGHAVGDEVIVAVSQMLKNNTCSASVCGRIGGDEFAIFLYGVTSAKRVENKLRLRLEDEKIYQDVLKTYHIRLSYGVAQYTGREDWNDAYHKLYVLADQKLYRMKKHKQESKK